MIIPDIVEEPKLLDVLINEIRQALDIDVPWLNSIYGTSFIATQRINNRDDVYPVVYIGKSEYRSMLPDESSGNYVFFELNDPVLYSNKIPGRHMIEAECSIIFWFNLKTIFADDASHQIEAVKKDILNVLEKPGIIKSGRIKVTSIFHRPKNIFNLYSLNEVASQFLMHPFSGLRFYCTLSYTDICKT